MPSNLHLIFNLLYSLKPNKAKHLVFGQAIVHIKR